MVRSRLSATDLLLDPLLAGGLAGLGALQRELSRRSPSSEGVRRVAGTVNIGVEGSGVHVVCVAPGMKADELSVIVHGKRLELTGRRSALEKAANLEVQRNERWSGEFRRVVELPFAVDPEQVDAVYSKGVLTVKLTRRGDEKRTIEIKKEG